jgi:hypothetical protein
MSHDGRDEQDALYEDDRNMPEHVHAKIVDL